MSESRLSSKEPPQSPRPMRIRFSDIPALFSEGAEPKADDLAKAWWPHVETKKLRLKMRLARILRPADRSHEEFLVWRYARLNLGLKCQHVQVFILSLHLNLSRD